LRKLALKIIHSSTVILPVWKDILKELKKRDSCMPQDVATQWNSMFDMLEYVLKHRKAVDTVTQQRGLGLRKFELADHEWELIEQLHSILKDATLFFSRATPNLTTIIPVMDHIDEKLTTHSLDPTYTPAIRAALWIAKKTLNHYYQLTDSSEVYHIAMSEYSTTFNLAYHTNTLTTNTGSITPSTQTHVLQSCLVGRRLDQNGRGTCAK
ncbi:hypothetical protein PAXRUDRAFT_166904, partial [Paxillus rubicundulus Ve08.2h10]